MAFEYVLSDSDCTVCRYGSTILSGLRRNLDLVGKEKILVGKSFKFEQSDRLFWYSHLSCVQPVSLILYDEKAIVIGSNTSIELLHDFVR